MNINDLKPNRLVFAGDWHAEHIYGSRAIEHARKVLNPDVIVHVGDFLAFEPHTTRFLDEIEAVLARTDLHLFFVDGNHEDFPYLNSLAKNEDGTGFVREHISYLPRGFRWEWSGKSFLALGGATSVDVERRRTGIDWFPEERITLGEAMNAAAGGHADVMVTHDVPWGSDVPPFKGTPWILPDHIVRTAEDHRRLLAEVVDEVKPQLLVHGHYHNPYSTFRTNPDGSKTLIRGLDCNGEPFNDNLSLFLVDRNA